MKKFNCFYLTFLLFGAMKTDNNDMNVNVKSIGHFENVI